MARSWLMKRLSFDRFSTRWKPIIRHFSPNRSAFFHVYYIPSGMRGTTKIGILERRPGIPGIPLFRLRIEEIPDDSAILTLSESPSDQPGSADYADAGLVNVF